MGTDGAGKIQCQMLMVIKNHKWRVESLSAKQKALLSFSLCLSLCLSHFPTSFSVFQDRHRLA